MPPLICRILVSATTVGASSGGHPSDLPSFGRLTEIIRDESELNDVIDDALFCVRAVRVRHAHRDLWSADPTDNTVAAIAHRWGFTHLGRFAAAHKALYGETPTQTLRAAR
jgi:AraC-like DNA-binding protein